MGVKVNGVQICVGCDESGREEGREERRRGEGGGGERRKERVERSDS
jgi:hypothetical protein